jgi:hypothetical protein
VTVVKQVEASSSSPTGKIETFEDAGQAVVMTVVVSIADETHVELENDVDSDSEVDTWVIVLVGEVAHEVDMASSGRLGEKGFGCDVYHKGLVLWLPVSSDVKQ